MSEIEKPKLSKEDLNHLVEFFELLLEWDQQEGGGKRRIIDSAIREREL